MNIMSPLTSRYNDHKEPRIQYDAGYQKHNTTIIKSKTIECMHDPRSRLQSW